MLGSAEANAAGLADIEYGEDPCYPFSELLSNLSADTQQTLLIAAGAAGVNSAKEVHLSNLLDDISNAKQQPKQRRKAPSTPPPSLDSYLVINEQRLRSSRAMAARPTRERISRPTPGAERGSGIDRPLPMPGLDAEPVRYNIRYDGSRPFLPAAYGRGQRFEQQLGFLPVRRDFSHWDQQRMAAPERAWPSSPGAAELASWNTQRASSDKPGKSMVSRSSSLPSLAGRSPVPTTSLQRSLSVPGQGTFYAAKRRPRSILHGAGSSAVRC
mmetsp:Transcript_21540/g.46983  ORF Transcript_21540/g.46983 Transcript_21540/m.46983 type:complete len:270 (-) Transcript_21540:29-838(-)